MTQHVVTSISQCRRTAASSLAASATPLSLRIVPWSEPVRAEWRALERRIGDVPLAATSSWTTAWLHAYGDSVDARVVVAAQGGRTCGLALLVRSRNQRVGPWRVSTLHVGTAGEVDVDSACVEYNGLLAETAFRGQFAKLLIERAVGECAGDELRLDGFDEASAEELMNGLPGAAAASRVSRYFDLASARASGQTVMDRLGSSTRSALRRALKKTGDVQVAQARSLDEADDVLTELIELHQARWQVGGQPGAFASPRFTAFQRDLIAQLLPEERVVLLRVRSSSLTVGCLMLLVDRGRLLDYLSGFAAFDETPSPGIVSHYLAMEWALTRNFRAYDFLVGDKRHKSNLATDSQNLVWATWRRPTWKNRTIAGLRRVKRMVAQRRRNALTSDRGDEEAGR